MKGIRQIINHHPENPGLTWPKVHSGDYLTTDEKFRRGYALLQKYGLSFDLQVSHSLQPAATKLSSNARARTHTHTHNAHAHAHTRTQQVNPHQLKDAAAFVAQFPEIPVCLNHLGCLPLKEGTPEQHEALIATWREGMQALARLPHVYVKLSQLWFTKDGWEKKGSAEELLLKSLVKVRPHTHTPHTPHTHTHTHTHTHPHTHTHRTRSNGRCRRRWTCSRRSAACTRPTSRWTSCR